MVERDFQGQHGKENLSKQIILMLPIDGSVQKLPEAVRQPCAEFIIFLYVFTDNYHSQEKKVDLRGNDRVKAEIKSIQTTGS